MERKRKPESTTEKGAFWDREQHVTSVPVGHNAEWRIGLAQQARTDSKPHITFRKWFQSAQAVWLPTKQGGVFDTETAVFLQDAIQQALTQLEAQDFEVSDGDPSK